MKKLFLLPYIIFGLAGNATDYYISSSGNDANNGTSTLTPWKTISKINSSSFSPGDHIYFKRGDMWREQLTIPSSGSAGNMITFGAYGSGAKPVINGANVMTGWTNGWSNHWYIASPNAVPTRGMVVVGGTIYAQVASLAALTSANKYFIDISTFPDRLYVYSTVDPATLTAEVSNREYCIVTASGANSKRFIEIDDIEVRYAGRGGIYFEGPGDQTSDALNGSSIVRRCTAYANNIYGIAHYDHYDNFTVEDCDASYNGNGFYSWVSDEGTFRRCSAANQIQYDVTFTDGHAFGGYRSDNWLVENCNSINDNDAIHIDAGNTKVNAIIRYNKVFNGMPGSPNTPCMGVGNAALGSNVQIYYNLLVNGASACFESYSLMNGNVDFFNNTCYNSVTTGTEAIFANHLSSTNWNIKNNIFVRQYVPGEYNYRQDGGTPTSLDYNLYFTYNQVSGTLRNYYNGTVVTTIAALRTTSGKEANSISVDPLLVDVTSDWSLQSGSPAINAGVNVGLTRDILGNPIVGLPDMGAYEHQNASPNANAGADQTITLPTNSVSLNGTGTDPDGTIANYAWSYVSGPTTFTLSSANSATTTLSNLVEGTYVFRLTVTDNGGALATDEVTVTVNVVPQCSSTAALSAGNIINDNSIGVFNFSSPGDAAASDNSSSSASAIVTMLSGNTNYLKATDFNFPIPSTASICGILVEVEKSASNISLSATVTDNSVRLVKGGIITGNDYATATDWSSTENYYSYGGPSDQWGTTWTPDEINASDFGLVFSAHINGIATLLPSASIDHIRVTVYYNLILPVQLTAFSAKVQDAQSNLLQWTTHDNHEETSFTVQRSSNGKDWKNIQTLKGEKADYKTYEFNDACSDAVVFYRISIMDRDGRPDYSAIARISRLARNILSVYPNPANNYLLIDYPEKLYNIACISANGQTYSVRFQKNGGSSYTIDIRHLPKGIYIIRLDEKSRMFVKQ